MAIVIRLLAIGILLVGPWTDDPTELSGWDAERFQEIADRDGAAWVDQPIEYPPGSVLVFDLVAGDDVVGTNRAIIVVAAVAEVTGTALIWRSVGSRAAKAFTILGLPLVPMGYLRLDLLVTVIAAAAAIALFSTFGDRATATGRRVGHGLFAALVVIGAMIKIWPALLIVGAVGVNRRLAASGAAALGAVAGVAWLGALGAGLDPLDQILSLRGATGWHLESLPGSLIALGGDADPRLELNAFRIGTLNNTAVTVGRGIAITAMAWLAISAARSPSDAGTPVERFALVMLGSVAVLIVTAPLLSPQFLLWLTPWGALLAADRARARLSPPLALLAAALLLTGFTLTAFGPANLAGTIPAALISIRNLALLALPVACLRALNAGPKLAVGRGR